MPIAISDTDAMKPGVARVTSTPCALAASTSMLRISTATRRNAQQSGASGKNSAGPGVWRSDTMISQPFAASASALASSTLPEVLSRTSPSLRISASARGP